MLGILLQLLVTCVIVGMVRKLRGGNCLPLPGSAGETELRPVNQDMAQVRNDEQRAVIFQMSNLRRPLSGSHNQRGPRSDWSERNLPGLWCAISRTGRQVNT
jgi:hypothetical protein